MKNDKKTRRVPVQHEADRSMSFRRIFKLIFFFFYEGVSIVYLSYICSLSIDFLVFNFFEHGVDRSVSSSLVLN